MTEDEKKLKKKKIIGGGKKEEIYPSIHFEKKRRMETVWTSRVPQVRVDFLYFARL